MATPGLRYRLTRPLPVVWRDAGVLQLGLDDGVLLAGVPPVLDQAVLALTEPRSYTELERLVPGLSRIWLTWLLRQLQNNGLLVTHQPTGTQVGLLGAGRLADTIAAGLEKSRLTDVVRTAHSRPRSRRNVTVLPRWDEMVDDLPRFVVVATDSSEPDRSLTDVLARTGRSHLVVRQEADRAVVGPLVVPGLTPCVRCHDLVRCRCDPAWPQLVAQLCRDRPPVDPVLLAWAASTAVVQVRCHLAGGEPDAMGRTLELSSADHTLHVRDWQVHPGCGCVLATA